ncbi:MAG TPA: hypothetical protein DCG30_07340 [Ruminococcus sp.]|nr:hypothetical protein [Ruminococcus sp.]
MKKLISFLAAASVIMTASCSTALAENSTDLSVLASSLGADTDYINIADKFYKSVDYDDLAAVNLYRMSKYYPIVSTNVSDMIPSEVSGLYGDSSLGTAILEVLSHNGNISPSDIKAGADSLKDIDNYDDIKEIIEYYSSSLKNNRIFSLYYKYNLNRITKNDRVDMLMDMAEKAMKDGKYFLITYGCYMGKVGTADVSENDDGSYAIDYKAASGTTRTQQVHTAAGMGITSGKWEFNGKTYDKCVLTIDNIAENGFSKDTCIYIDSQTKDFYIPTLSESAQGELHVASFDDTDMLNFNGLIKPTANYPLDDIDIATVSFSTGNDRITADFVCYDKDGNEIVYKDGQYTNCYSPARYFVNIDVNKFNVDFINDWYDDAGFWVHDKDKYVNGEIKNHDGNMSVDHGTYSFTKSEESDNNVYHNPKDPFYIYMNQRFYENENAPAGRRLWSLTANTDNNVIFTADEEGFYAETDGNAEIRYSACDYDGEETDLSVYKRSNGEKVAAGIIDIAKNKVLISVKNDFPCIYMDNNGDGVFDDECQRGDANCDGKLNAADASLVMQKYAGMATKPAKINEVEMNTFITSPYYDFNDDSVINASDASEILAEYAKSAT